MRGEKGKPSKAQTMRAEQVTKTDTARARSQGYLADGAEGSPGKFTSSHGEREMGR